MDCSVLSSSAGGVAEAEDSSYDSDYEAGDSSPTPSPQHHQHHRRRSSRRRRSATVQQHSDVSRTSSDTLAAEFAEYVTVHGANTTTTSQTPGKENDFLKKTEMFFFFCFSFDYLRLLTVIKLVIVWACEKVYRVNMPEIIMRVKK